MDENGFSETKCWYGEWTSDPPLCVPGLCAMFLFSLISYLTLVDYSTFNANLPFCPWGLGCTNSEAFNKMIGSDFKVFVIQLSNAGMEEAAMCSKYLDPIPGR